MLLLGHSFSLLERGGVIICLYDKITLEHYPFRLCGAACQALVGRPPAVQPLLWHLLQYRYGVTPLVAFVLENFSPNYICTKICTGYIHYRMQIRYDLFH